MNVRALDALALLACLAGAGPAHAQPVPEGIHSMGGPNALLCGRTVDSVPVLHQEIAARFPTLPGNDRYVAYEDEANRRIWTFTTDAHPAHPAVACRELVEREGSWNVAGNIACFSSRENCDALYREFEELNAQMRRQLGAR